MVVRCRVSGESSLVVKGTLNPPVSTLKVGHPIPPTLLVRDAWVLMFVQCLLIIGYIFVSKH